MPQMSPLNWIAISPLLITMLSFLISLLYFFSFPYISLKKDSSKPKISWMW